MKLLLKINKMNVNRKLKRVWKRQLWYVTLTFPNSWVKITVNKKKMVAVRLP
jgi:hypothetical protein